MQETTANNGVSERLRKFLKFRGLSIREFSERADVPYRTLQDYLAGKRRPGADHLIRMAGAGLDIDWLLTGRVAHPLRLLFGDQEASGADVLAADKALLNLILETALDGADAFVERHFERTGESLSAHKVLHVIGYYYEVMLMVATKMVDFISEIRASPLTDTENAILGVLSAGVTPDLDYKIESVLSEVGQKSSQGLPIG